MNELRWWAQFYHPGCWTELAVFIGLVLFILFCGTIWMVPE